MTDPENKTKALAQVETSVCGLVLHNLEDMTTVAQVILQSGLAPDSFQTKEQIFVGLQTGAEIGLKPMQALNSIVVIKGSPRLWGDAALALVKRSGLCEYCKEYFELKGIKLSEKDAQYADLIGYPDGFMAVCETKRKEGLEPVISYFSVADAKLAGLWDKKSKKGGIMPWSTHPKRMLKYKARAFNLRDNFPDVLYGMHLAEEMVGEEPLPAPESDVPPRDERRMTVPSTAVDTTRAPVPGAKLTSESRDRIAAADMVPVEEEKPEGVLEAVVEEKAKTESELVTFLCKKCGQTFQYGRKEGKGVPCECGKGILVEFPEQAEPSKEEKIASIFMEVNGMYVEKGGKDFTEFAAYVLCLDDEDIGKLSEAQLNQIKAYIQTNEVAIN